MGADVLLERSEVEVFLALAEELHFGRAAERLHLSTGRVSQTVRKLERRIGAPLFERTSRRVRLTPIGRRLADDLAPHVSGMDEAVRRAIDAARGITGVLRVGFLGAGAGQLLLKAVTVFAAAHPDCEVHIHEAQIHDAAPKLFDGEIDVLVTALPMPGAVNGPVLLTEPCLLAVPADHPWARRESVSSEVLADHPVVQVSTNMPEETLTARIPARTPSGRPVARGPVADTFPEILALVATGRGIFPVGEHAARFYPRPDVAYVPVHDAPPVRWGPVWLPANDTERVREFVRAAEAAARRSDR